QPPDVATEVGDARAQSIAVAAKPIVTRLRSSSRQKGSSRRDQVQVTTAKPFGDAKKVFVATKKL
ncbi:MAG TPA: hypothetical protein VN493_02145, partial [Thermoanaerobaculia bacterium]|nr:hypothetical protein [Thermoanaerobaculia bacterium]